VVVKADSQIRFDLLKEIAVLVKQIAGLPEKQWDSMSNQDLTVARNALKIAAARSDGRLPK
jgi:hypothetical protein